MRRRSNWPRRLLNFIRSREARPFRWGKNDCCLFACDGIRAITGLDPAAKVFRGKYRDTAGATRLLKKHGGVEAIAETQCAAHGFAEISVLLAQRGDVVLFDMPDGPTLGICEGTRAAFVGINGLVRQDIARCRRAWRVA